MVMLPFLSSLLSSLTLYTWGALLLKNIPEQDLPYGAAKQTRTALSPSQTNRYGSFGKEEALPLLENRLINYCTSTHGSDQRAARAAITLAFQICLISSSSWVRHQTRQPQSGSITM